MDDVSLVYVTASSMDEAERLARDAVEARLAACANILPGMRSIYRWKNGLETAEECVLILKTRAALVDALTARIVERHSYETPCVVALPVSAGAAGFLGWLRDQTADKA